MIKRNFQNEEYILVYGSRERVVTEDGRHDRRQPNKEAGRSHLQSQTEAEEKEKQVLRILLGGGGSAHL